MSAIAAGGFLGTLGRYELALAWPTPAGHLPWSTFSINTSGSFLLGLGLTWLLGRFGRTSSFPPFLCVGVLGAWTTMSSFAIEADLLLRDGYARTACIYIVLTVFGGLTAAWLGVALARRLVHRESPWSLR